MSILSNQNYPKKTPLYSCNNCLFFTSNKKDYNRHTDTIKHKSIVCQGFSIELPQKTPKNPRSFTCNCGKVYNDNSGLWRHKKKYECSNDNHTTNDVVKLETEQKEDNNSPDKELIMILIKQNTELMEIVKNEELKIKYICPNCLKDFKNRKGDYIRHINKKISCISEVNKKMEEMNNYIQKLKEDIEKKDNDILQLKQENETLKQQMIIYSKIPNNTYNTNYNYILQINNFNDTNYEGNIDNLLKYIGKSIYINTVKNVYLNNEKPGNHNIYIADKVRGIVKIWNNGIWQSKNMLIIDQIIDRVVEHFHLSIEEIKKDHNKYEKLKKNISNKIQYVQLCDIDYLEDLEDDPIENKERIQRCKDFRQMVYNEIIILLHDNKKTVLDTHKRKKINIKD